MLTDNYLCRLLKWHLHTEEVLCALDSLKNVVDSKLLDFRATEPCRDIFSQRDPQAARSLSRRIILHVSATCRSPRARAWGTEKVG